MRTVELNKDVAYLLNCTILFIVVVALLMAFYTINKRFQKVVKINTLQLECIANYATHLHAIHRGHYITLYNIAI